MIGSDAAVALHRFGLGPRPGDLQAIQGDPRAALIAETLALENTRLDDAGLVTSADAIREVRGLRLTREPALGASSSADPLASRMGESTASKGQESTGVIGAGAREIQELSVARQKVVQRIFRREVASRIRRVMEVQIGFAERLVVFWTNHFALEAGTGILRASTGAFEREAIRPHVFGYFDKMLLAATKHPAMLIYLDNTRSIGPNSRVGRRRQRGLNENHAREILELHTVGADGSYTQEDVTALARVLTGWTVGLNPGSPETLGRFHFDPRIHEPGSQTIMGVVHPAAGVEQGENVLFQLADHPGTGRRIAHKLARHFVADDPADDLVSLLEGVFVRTGGDLGALSRALVEADGAWIPESKLKAPQEFLWSAARALNVELTPAAVRQMLGALGQPLWDPPSPEGFPDDTENWLAPDALTSRLDVGEQLAAQSRAEATPLDLVPAILGPRVSEETRVAISRAESRTQGLALLLMSPEFQRR